MKRRKWTCWIYTVLSLYGLALALIFAEIEICKSKKWVSLETYEVIQPIKISITLSTVILIMTTIFYHYNEIQIFKFDNSLSPKSTLKVVGFDHFS